jgi:23S rRNA pseudouridine2604 synthase
MNRIRVSRLLADRGLCSRREADDYIRRGWVRVDGEVVDQPGAQVDPGCDVRLTRQAHHRQQGRLTVLLNKPTGFVSGPAEKGYRPAAMLLSAANRMGPPPPGLPPAPDGRRMAPAGRLDIDSHGLLILTEDGRVARHVIAPDSEIEKEYLVRVRGEVTEETLERLRHGLKLDGRRLKPARIDAIDAQFLRFVLTEGRKRQIRRMCEQVGLEVHGLKRVRIGRVVLGGLPLGKWRYLHSTETI